MDTHVNRRLRGEPDLPLELILEAESWWNYNIGAHSNYRARSKPNILITNLKMSQMNTDMKRWSPGEMIRKKKVFAQWFNINDSTALDMITKTTMPTPSKSSVLEYAKCIKYKTFTPLFCIYLSTTIVFIRYERMQYLTHRYVAMTTSVIKSFYLCKTYRMTTR